ncbi:MAG: LON peptidase substrate-binding domain-containing protein [Steroidobacteraceae bacterium]
MTADTESQSVTLALFPLNTVLFPGGPLPLRIFETRYTDMVRRCMRQRSSFGVLLIRAGAEVGSVTSTAEIGTSARIVDFYQLPDGLLGITCVGERKFRVRERSRQPDGLNVGKIEWLPPEAEVALPAEHHHLGQLLRKVLPELSELYQNVPKHFDDAGWVSSRLAEILPLELSDKQFLLEMDDPLVRLARVAPLIRRNEEG